MTKTTEGLEAHIIGGNKHPNDNCPEQARCFEVFTDSIAYLNLSSPLGRLREVLLHTTVTKNSEDQAENCHSPQSW